MDFGVALVDHVCPQINQPVNDPVDRILVTGNQARGEDNGVPRSDLDGGVLAIRHP